MKAFKETIKSSAQRSTQEEDDEYSEILLQSEEKPRSRLRSTQSARDLFGGRDIFNKITELCNELKKMTSWAKEREVEEAEKTGSKKEGARDILGSQRDKERKPFLELTKDTCEAGERSNAKKMLRKKKKYVSFPILYFQANFQFIITYHSTLILFGISLSIWRLR